MKEYKINRRQNVCICISVSQKLHLHNTVVPLGRRGEHGGAVLQSSSRHMKPHNAPVTEQNRSITIQPPNIKFWSVLLLFCLFGFTDDVAQLLSRNISTTIWWFQWNYCQIFGSKTINQPTVRIPDWQSCSIDRFITTRLSKHPKFQDKKLFLELHHQVQVHPKYSNISVY